MERWDRPRRGRSHLTTDNRQLTTIRVTGGVADAQPPANGYDPSGVALHTCLRRFLTKFLPIYSRPQSLVLQKCTILITGLAVSFLTLSQRYRDKFHCWIFGRSLPTNAGTFVARARCRGREGRRVCSTKPFVAWSAGLKKNLLGKKPPFVYWPLEEQQTFMNCFSNPVGTSTRERLRSALVSQKWRTLYGTGESGTIADGRP